MCTYTQMHAHTQCVMVWMIVKHTITLFTVDSFNQQPVQTCASYLFL